MTSATRCVGRDALTWPDASRPTTTGHHTAPKNHNPVASVLTRGNCSPKLHHLPTWGSGSGHHRRVICVHRQNSPTATGNGLPVPCDFQQLCTRGFCNSHMPLGSHGPRRCVAPHCECCTARATFTCSTAAAHDATMTTRRTLVM